MKTDRGWQLVALALLGLLCMRGASGAFAEELAGFDCLVDPYLVSDVSTREEGVLEELLVKRGDLVEKGQAVARLDAEIEEATVALAQAKANLSGEIQERRERLAFLRRELKRLRDLRANKAVSSRDVDEAASEAHRAKLFLEQAKEKEQLARLELVRAEKVLGNRTIHSPVKGIVVDTLLSPGESVENRPLVQIAQVDPLKVEVIVPVEYFGAIAVGAKAEVLPRYPHAQAHTATVTVVDRVVDAASDTFGVLLELPNEGYEIPGGVRCEIRFEVPDRGQ